MEINLYQKYTNLEPNHPFLSRICFQINDVLKFCNLSEEQKQNVRFFCLYEGLLNMETLWEIEEKITSEYFNSLNNWLKNPSNYFPSIIGLRRDINLYLYTIKNTLRDILLYVMNPIYGTKFFDGGYFSNLKDGISPVKKWIYKNFGEHSKEYKIINNYEDFLTELIAKRNAMEHPNGKCGILEIKQPFLEKNITPQGKEVHKITHPRWARNDQPFISIIDDLCETNYRFMCFVEEFILFVCLENFLDKEKFIGVIPGNKRVLYNGKRYAVFSKINEYKDKD